MASNKQIAANRRNARSSTGPKTKKGKLRARRNALRHGLTAEVIVHTFEERQRYKAFEDSIVASYAPRSPVEQELALRLTSLLWRIRRANAIETGLLQIQADILREKRAMATAADAPSSRTNDIVRNIIVAAQGTFSEHLAEEDRGGPGTLHPGYANHSIPVELARCFLRVANLNNDVFERVGRYEATLWRQAAQVILLLGHPKKSESGRCRENQLWPK